MPYFLKKIESFGLYLKILFIPCGGNNYRPKILEGKYLICILLLACVLRLSTFLFFWQLPNTDFFADISKMILIDSLNQERTSFKLGSLKESTLLDQAAFLKANDMMQKGYFSHTSPSGVTPWYWFKKVGYNYKSAGENLGIGFVDSQELHRAWDNSPSHRANLLNGNYKEIGIAVVEGNFNGLPTTIVVQHFGTPKTKTSQMPSNTAVSNPRAASSTASNQATANLIHNFPSTGSAVVAGASTTFTFVSTATIAQTGEKQNSGIKGFWAGFLKFFVKDYNDLTQMIVLIFLAINIIALILNIVIKIFIQHYDLVLKSILVAFSLILLVSIGPEEIMALVQPQARIF
ncbi:MAG: CAP domain-containing protein [Patescibacteria group bacterium]|nr:CAP domain-containing protein [Patescibacteria group bacterium]